MTVLDGLSSAAAYRMLGATAMIGDNDDSVVFSIDADARLRA